MEWRGSESLGGDGGEEWDVEGNEERMEGLEEKLEQKRLE